MPIVKLAFLDVGQGDTIVISCPETQEAIVVDCVKSTPVVDYLRREDIKSLRGIIITHLHMDHYQQVANLLYNCADVVGTQGCEILATADGIVNPADLRKESVQEKWPPDKDGHSTVYNRPDIVHKEPSAALAKLYQWTEENDEKCRIIRAWPSAPFPIEGTLAQSIEVLHPPHLGYERLRMSGLNNISVVLRIKGTRSSALLTGDLEPAGWQHLKSKHPDLKSDVLKFPHHGGTWEEEETRDLVDTIKPSTIVISVGTDNSYDHPNSGAFATLYRRRDIHLLCTEATDKCQPCVLNQQAAVIEKFKSQTARTNAFLITPKKNQKQCPCAGTVIIELNDQPRIIQPKSTFHETIIDEHYKEHQCYISIATPSVT